METKVCTKCKEEKELSEFYKNKSKKCGLERGCKSCKAVYDKEYSKNNKEKIKQRGRDYREKNKDKLKERRKKYHEANKETENKKSSEYYAKNKEKISLQSKHYRNKNRDRRKKYIREYTYDKSQNDTLFKLKENIKCLIRNSVKYKGFSKNTKTANILGCDYEEFKNYLEDNPYGFTIEDEGLDLDHIIPVSTAETEEEIHELNHYTNFQLLPSEYNRNIKINRPFDRNNFENWLKQ